MSSQPVAQVVVVHGQKIVDLETRVNDVLAGMPASSVLDIDYLFEPETYGMVAIIRYLAEG
jgi:hypothetical protein